MDDNSKQIAGLILGAAAGFALYQFFSMTKEKREEFYTHLKNTTYHLLDNADDTVEIVEQYISQFNEKGKGEWIDKLCVLKKMFGNLYGTGKHYWL